MADVIAILNSNPGVLLALLVAEALVRRVSFSELKRRVCNLEKYVYPERKEK